MEERKGKEEKDQERKGIRKGEEYFVHRSQFAGKEYSTELKPY